MAAATLPNYPSNLENCYFIASDKIMKTDDGKIWEKSFQDFLKHFMRSRSEELRSGGVFCMVTSSYSHDSTINPFQLKEEEFYQGLF